MYNFIFSLQIRQQNIIDRQQTGRVSLPAASCLEDSEQQPSIYEQKFIKELGNK